MTGETTSPTAPVRRHLTPTSTAVDLALVATFAALIAACALLSIGVLAVPITLQTFAVLLTGAVLGPRRALLAVGLYLAIGFAGVPVFSAGRSGLSILAGPSVGYIVSFPVAAALTGLLVGRIPARTGRGARTALAVGACVAATVAVVYPLGIAGMMWRLDLSLAEAVTANATFVPGDLLKCVAAGVAATAVLRAFPRLQRSPQGGVGRARG